MTAPTSGAVVLGLLRRRIDDDFGPAGLPAVWFLDPKDWDSQLPPLVEVEQDPVVDTSEVDVVCVCGGRSFLIHLQDGLETAVAAVASALQDEVMDQLNRPWPTAAGGAVLQPFIDRSGLAVWASADGEIRCPVGYLRLLGSTA